MRAFAVACRRRRHAQIRRAARAPRRGLREKSPAKRPPAPARDPAVSACRARRPCVRAAAAARDRAGSERFQARRARCAARLRVAPMADATGPRARDACRATAPSPDRVRAAADRAALLKRPLRDPPAARELPLGAVPAREPLTGPLPPGRVAPAWAARTAPGPMRDVGRPPGPDRAPTPEGCCGAFGVAFEARPVVPDAVPTRPRAPGPPAGLPPAPAGDRPALPPRFLRPPFRDAWVRASRPTARRPVDRGPRASRLADQRRAAAVPAARAAPLPATAMATIGAVTAAPPATTNALPVAIDSGTAGSGVAVSAGDLAASGVGGAGAGPGGGLGVGGGAGETALVVSDMALLPSAYRRGPRPTATVTG